MKAHSRKARFISRQETRMCVSGGVAQVTDGNGEFLMKRTTRQRAAEDAS